MIYIDYIWIEKHDINFFNKQWQRPAYVDNSSIHFILFALIFAMITIPLLEVFQGRDIGAGKKGFQIKMQAQIV